MATKVNKQRQRHNYKNTRKDKVETKPFLTFGYKSAFIIFLTALLTSVIIPYLLYLAGVDSRMLTIFLNAVSIPMAVCYCQFFIETKKGITKTCIQIFILLMLAMLAISYSMLYM